VHSFIKGMSSRRKRPAFMNKGAAAAAGRANPFGSPALGGKAAASLGSSSTGGGGAPSAPQNGDPLSEGILQELMDMYKEKHGTEASAEAVEQWRTQFREAAANKAAGPAGGAAAGAGGASSLAELRQKFSGGGLGLSFSGQTAVVPLGAAAPAAPAAPAAAPSFASASSVAPQPERQQQLRELNQQFRAWVEQNAAAGGGSNDLTPGILDYIEHMKYVLGTGGEGAGAGGKRARAEPVTAVAAASEEKGEGQEEEEKELDEREQKLQAFVSSSAAQSKMQAFMAGMKAKMQALQEARGEGAPITKEDIRQIKNELMAEMG